MQEENQLFKSFSRNLNLFLKNEGIFPVKKGVHTTGVQISPNNGTTWDDYTSLPGALEDYYAYFTREDLEALVAKSFQTSAPVFGAAVDGNESNDILVRKRVRYFEEYEMTDRLHVALKRWKESGPKK